MNTVIEVDGLSKRFGSFTAIDGVSLRIEENRICGLLGRNGAGKTTMMQLLTGQDFRSAGSIRVFGEDPVENAPVLARTCFVKENQKYPDDYKPVHVFRSAPWFFPNWDADFAARLVDDGILYKKRGIGMFVSEGSRERLVAKRREQFSHEFVRPLLAEAVKLGISPAQLITMIQKEGSQ